MIEPIVNKKIVIKLYFSEFKNTKKIISKI